MLPNNWSDYAMEPRRERRTSRTLIGQVAEPSGRNARPAITRRNHALNGCVNVPNIDDVRKWATESGFGEDHGAARRLAYANSRAGRQGRGKTALNVAGPNRDNAAPPCGAGGQRGEEARRDQQNTKNPGGSGHFRLTQ